MFNSLCLLMTHWMQNAAELQSTCVATSILNGLCSVMAVTCNLVVILVIVRSPSLHIPSYVLPCNLAISDLGVGLVVQPLYIAVPIEQLKEEVDLSCKLGAAYKLIAICFGALSFFYFYRHQHRSLSRSVSCKQIPQHCDIKEGQTGCGFPVVSCNYSNDYRSFHHNCVLYDRHDCYELLPVVLFL